VMSKVILIRLSILKGLSTWPKARQSSWAVVRLSHKTLCFVLRWFRNTSKWFRSRRRRAQEVPSSSNVLVLGLHKMSGMILFTFVRFAVGNSGELEQ